MNHFGRVTRDAELVILLADDTPKSRDYILDIHNSYPDKLVDAIVYQSRLSGHTFEGYWKDAISGVLEYHPYRSSLASDVFETRIASMIIDAEGSVSVIDISPYDVNYDAIKKGCGSDIIAGEHQVLHLHGEAEVEDSPSTPKKKSGKRKAPGAPKRSPSQKRTEPFVPSPVTSFREMVLRDNERMVKFNTHQDCVRYLTSLILKLTAKDVTEKTPAYHQYLGALTLVNKVNIAGHIKYGI